MFLFYNLPLDSLAVTIYLNFCVFNWVVIIVKVDLPHEISVKSVLFRIYRLLVKLEMSKPFNSCVEMVDVNSAILGGSFVLCL